MKTTLEKIAVMQAFEDGKTIEYNIKDRGIGWAKSSYPLWNWGESDYRIKPLTLEEAASKYCEYWEVSILEKAAVKNTFKAGAKWQKEQSE